MTPIRVSAKFFVEPDPTAEIDLRPFIGLFHRFIQQGTLEGLLIDVADYAHVPNGPGVLLIGHDVDYAMDLTGGRAGLMVTSKRQGDTPLARVLEQTLRRALIAVREVGQDESTALRFDVGAFELRFIDSLGTPNDAQGFAAVRAEIEPVLAEFLGRESFTVEPIQPGDLRRALAISVAGAQASKALSECQGAAAGA